MKYQFLLVEGEKEERTMRVVDEAVVSNRFDMDDCHNEPFEVYVLKDGWLQVVKLGEQNRINTDQETPFHFAKSDLVANCVVVGSVTHTDH